MAGAPNQQALLALLADGSCRRLDDLIAALALRRRQTCEAAEGLIRRGYLERAEVGCFRLTPAGLEAQAQGEILTNGSSAPRPQVRPRRGLRARIWRALRLRRRVTIGDVVRLASRGDEKNARGNANRYLGILAKAGYLRRLTVPKRDVETTPGSPWHLRYELVRDTGPEAPIPRDQLREVYDPNLGEVVWREGGRS